MEGLIRFFHLTKDYPVRFIDEYGVERWVPNQDGFSVTGIRRQNFSKFHINDFGFNSYREFKPSLEKTEIALLGNSFIEGFHQDYYNSLGKKIETNLPEVEVYEFGYAGYDMADLLHLIYKYQSTFDLVDYVFLGLKFEQELTRGEYGVIQGRMKLESPLYKNLRKIKLLVYLQKNGAFDTARRFTNKILTLGNRDNAKIKSEDYIATEKKFLQHIKNFESLIAIYGFDKKRYVLLIDKGKTPKMFINYLENKNFQYVDFSKALSQSKKPTTLIYDRHWNNQGRNIVASVIVNYVKTKIKPD
nr:hypothetical protein [Flaviramulus sp.]